jgi:hypothetical protein
LGGLGQRRNVILRDGPWIARALRKTQPGQVCEEPLPRPDSKHPVASIHD